MGVIYFETREAKKISLPFKMKYFVDSDFLLPRCVVNDEVTTRE